MGIKDIIFLKILFFLRQILQSNIFYCPYILGEFQWEFTIRRFEKALVGFLSESFGYFYKRFVFLNMIILF